MGTIKLSLNHSVVIKSLAHVIRHPDYEVCGLVLTDKYSSGAKDSKNIFCTDVFPLTHTRLLIPILHISDILFGNSGDFPNELGFETPHALLNLNKFPILEQFYSEDEVIDSLSNSFKWNENKGIVANNKNFYESESDFAIESQLKNYTLDELKVVAMYTTKGAVRLFDNGIEGISGFKDTTFFSELPLIMIDAEADRLLDMFKTRGELEIYIDRMDVLTEKVTTMLQNRHYRKIRDLDDHLGISGLK